MASLLIGLLVNYFLNLKIALITILRSEAHSRTAVAGAFAIEIEHYSNEISRDSLVNKATNLSFP